MPLASRLFIKAGLCWLLLSILLVAAIQFPGTGFTRLWMPVFYHMLMVGWITQMIFGVAIWMFPGDRSIRAKHAGRGKTKGNIVVHYGVFGLLNTGLLFRVIFEPLTAGLVPHVLSDATGDTTATATAYMLLLSGILQFTAFSGFTYQIWPRIRGKHHA